MQFATQGTAILFCAFHMQDVMIQAEALQLKAEHDIRQSSSAVQQATRKLQRIQQEAAEKAEAAWQQQLAEHAAAAKLEQERVQAEQVCSCRPQNVVPVAYAVAHFTTDF